jgi:hypothetical protein
MDFPVPESTVGSSESSRRVQPHAWHVRISLTRHLGSRRSSQHRKRVEVKSRHRPPSATQAGPVPQPARRPAAGTPGRRTGRKAATSFGSALALLLRLNPQSAKQPAPWLNPAVRSVNPSRTAPGPHRTLQIPQGHRSAVQRNSGALLARLRHRIRWVILHFPLSTGIQSRHSTCEHDHRQSPCQRYDRLRSTAPAGNIQCPGL